MNEKRLTRGPADQFRRFVRAPVFVIMMALGGCMTGAAVLSLPAGLTRVIGGISDVRPYYGILKTDQAGLEGNFMLATCGCGDWRMLAQMPDGQQWQFPVGFYSNGEYQPTGEIVVFGEEEGEVLLGILNQDSGAFGGSGSHESMSLTVAAQRGDNHTENAQACVLCHIGENPVWPQPPDHPPLCADGATEGCYTTSPANCLTCHTVVITD